MVRLEDAMQLEPIQFSILLLAHIHIHNSCVIIVIMKKLRLALFNKLVEKNG